MHGLTVLLVGFRCQLLTGNLHLVTGSYIALQTVVCGDAAVWHVCWCIGVMPCRTSATVYAPGSAVLSSMQC